MSKDTSGPAFPVPGMDLPNGEFWHPYAGMTLRQWYAGLAMQQMVAVEYEGHDPAKRAAAWARDAYIVADAMLAEGNKQ